MRDPDARRDPLRTAGPWVLDGLLALAAAAVGVSLLATVLPFDPGSPRAWAAYLLLLAHTLPLHRRRPAAGPRAGAGPAGGHRGAAAHRPRAP